MDVALLRKGKCVDIAVFDDMKTAMEFLSMGVWENIDGVEELPEHRGIGDLFLDGEWSSPPFEENPSPPEPDGGEPTIEDILDILEKMLGVETQ